ncbi:MAG: N-acetylmuramoyl-L-alanine amidase [Clostridium sp.]|uniref:N-acetylmuramoyl-L-alanine amidase n=1 Tax=Clostridium sp. TaxID=1506 RepID=UPI0039956058
MFKTKYVSRVLCVLFIVNLFIADLKPLATSYSSSSIGNIDIISNVDVSVESVEAWAKSKNATETFVSLASIYKKYGQARGGVNWVLAYVQAAKETGYGRFGGVLDESFHNPCGLKVPSGGDDYDQNAHKRFDNWEQGIIAHLDHLALYAGAKGYPKTVYVESWKAESLSINETYDPRHIGWFGTTSGILGKATNAIDLGNKWAPSSSYGVDLFRMYCDAVKADYLEGKSNLESPINGFVTNDGKLNIKGWALHAFGVKEVRVLIDNTQIDTISVNESRADVNSTYPGYYNGTNSGFNKIIDISSLGYGNKVLEIRIVANDNSTQVYRRNIVFTNTLESRSYLDAPNDNEVVKSKTLNVRGWALAGSGVKEVRVYVDGKDLGTVAYGAKRADVNKAYPGYSSGDNAGFEGNVNISGISEGNRKLTVKITANDGSVQNIEKTIKIEKAQSRSYLDAPNDNEVVKSKTLNVRGWALAGSGVKEVRVYVDGKDLGTVAYGAKRADVNKAYPGYSSGDNAGFEGNVNISGISEGNRKLTVKITANDGSVQNIERSFNIENDFNYKKAKLVIVDPGHENDGGDPGTSATHNGIRYIESNLNLQIAVKLKAELESRGMEVYMTRYEGSGLISQDSTESLKKRVALANEKNADFFVSIHHNSFTNTSANGFEVYYSTGTPANLTSIARSAITEDGRDLTLERSLYSTRSVTEKVKVSKAVATEITNEASSKLNMYNRGAKDSNFYVCKNTNMPSILVENGFLTNPTEAVKASSSSHQQKLAQIIADKVNNALK